MRTLLMSCIAMTMLWSPAPALAGGHSGVTSGMDERIKAALANPERPADHVERDVRSQPEVVLKLLDLQPGQAVVDIFGGGGYYAELLAGMVGPDGKVILQNNSPYEKWVADTLQERFVEQQWAPIEVLKSEVDDLQLAPNSLDAALMVMSYHDLHYFAPDRGWDRTDVPAFLSQVFAALQSGAQFVIVDHAATAGTGASAAQDLHRIEDAYVEAEVLAAGFAKAGSSDALRNSQDARTKLVFDKSIRGGTDRFVLAFVKP
jgi:predicted methyltransferase